MTFAYCDSLREVNFHENFRKIGEQAFYNCWALEYLDLPQSIQEYDQGALSWTGLKSIALPDGLTALPDGLLSYNGQLEDVYIPQSVTVFGDGVFGNCTKLKQIQLPSGLSKIGKGVFCNCYKLEHIELPNGIREIPDNAFGSCQALKQIKLPDGVKSIGSQALSNCISIESIDLPESVSELAYRALCFNPKMTALYCRSVTPPTCKDDAFDACKFKECTIYVPFNTKSAYETSPGFRLFSNIVETDFSTDLNNPLAEREGNAPIYHLNGSVIKTARKGLYIQNGKKILK